MVGYFSTLATCTLIASALALPQSDVVWSATGEPLGKDMGFNISFWESFTCHGNARSVREVFLNSTVAAVTDDTVIASYKISRDMNSKEVLEFSIPGFGPCWKKLETTSPDSNGHPLVKDKCYTFLKGSTAQCFTYYQPADHGTTPEPTSAPVPQLLKRQGDAGVRLDTWQNLKCHGEPTASSELNVDMNTLLGQNFVAYKVSRTLGSIGYLYFGQADLSTFTPASGTTDYCTKFVEKASLPLHKGHCYSLAVGVSAHCANLHS